MHNQITIVGHVGADPEVRNLQSGTSVANFSVAVTERWKTKDGEQQERTDWFRCNAWGRLGEVCAQYLGKGSKVLVVGKMQSRKYQDKDGNDRMAWDLRADQVTFLDSKADREQGGGGGGGGGGWGNRGGGQQGGGGWGNRGGGQQGGGQQGGGGWGGGGGGWGGGQQGGGQQGGGQQGGFDDDPIPF